MSSQTSIEASCACGAVRFAAAGTPIMCVACYCDDCQAGSRAIEALPGAPPVLEADGASDYVLYRRDRFRCVAGGEHLMDMRLTSGSPTRRVVASCCNSAMVLDFEKGHWLSAYHGRFPPPPPPVQLRVQTRFRVDGPGSPDGAPAYRRFPLSFIGRLLKARAAMWLGR